MCVVVGKVFLQTWPWSLAIKQKHEFDETDWDFLLGSCWVGGTGRRREPSLRLSRCVNKY